MQIARVKLDRVSIPCFFSKHALVLTHEKAAHRTSQRRGISKVANLASPQMYVYAIT